jgi:hypothetical protein
VPKILIPLVALAIAALTWALWPAPPPDKASTAPTAAAKAGAVPAGAARPAAASPAPGTAPSPASAAPAPAPPPSSQAAAGAEPGSPGTAAAAAAGGNPGVGRAPGQPMPHIQAAAFHQTLQRFVSGLPANGRIEGPVLAEDVLPAAALAGFNVPAGSHIKEVEHLPATDPAAFKKVLNPEAKGQTVVGFTFVTPDGREIRDYLFVDP